MICAQRFISQCTAWQSFALISVIVGSLAGLIFGSLGLAGWDLIVKVFVSLGCVTCIFWWLWAMQRLKDIAAWWANLNANVDQASKLLSDTKSDIESIKKITKQENSLFG